MNNRHTRNRARIRLRAGAAGVALALALGACGGAGGDEPAGEGSDRHLVVAQTADVRSLFANSTTAQAEINVTAQMNEKLIEFTADAKGFEPRLATEWKQVDPTTLHLTLRDGVTFTNGEPFDAESAKFSLDTMLAAKAYASFTSSIASIDVVSDHVVAVKSKTPSDLVLASLAMGSFQYPKEYFAKVGEEAFAAKPIGTGPFVLEAWKKGVAITFKANEKYWGDKPVFDRLEFQIIPDKSAQVTALQSGEVDLVPDLPRGSVSQVKNAGDLQVVQRPSNRIWSLGINTVADTPLKNKKVRVALQYALDVDKLIAGPMNGFGTALDGQITTDAFFGFDPDRKAKGYDPQKAKALLAEAGYPNGFEVNFEYSVNHGKEIAQAIAAQLEEVGVKVKQNLLEPGTFLQKLSGKELSGLFMAGSLPPPDAHFMYQQYESNFRYSYYKNPTVDELIATEINSPDKETRKQVFKDMLAIFDDDPPYVPMYQAEDLYGLAGDLKGFTPRASQFLDLKALKIG